MAGGVGEGVGIKGREYPNRGGDPQVRVYFDMDDRLAEQVLNGRGEPREAPPREEMRNATPKRQAKKVGPPALEDLRARLERLKG